MILERKMQFNIPDLKQQLEEFGDNFEADSPEARGATLLEFAELMQLYSGAMREISTKLEVLDDEFHIRHSYNPIHHLECRVKGIRSIHEKMTRLGVSLAPESAREHVLDIAGIRVICNFINDVYLTEELLLAQTDVTLLERKDYIEKPKENGYRSLHLIVKVPVFLSNRTEDIPVEIQMRTIAMDYWASLEHMLQYKNSDDTPENVEKLLECANTLAETERVMQGIRNSVDR